MFVYNFMTGFLQQYIFLILLFEWENSFCGCPFSSLFTFYSYHQAPSAVVVTTVGNWWAGAACITLIIQYLWNSQLH